MANPRAAVRHTYHPRVVRTYAHDATIVYDETKVGNSEQVGLAVTFTGEAADTVSLVGDNEMVNGKLLKVEGDGFCAVQTHGEMTLPAGTSATITQGLPIVGDLLGSAEGYIQASGAGSAAIAQLARGTIVNNSVTTAVVVDLF